MNEIKYNLLCELSDAIKCGDEDLSRVLIARIDTLELLEINED